MILLEYRIHFRIKNRNLPILIRKKGAAAMQYTDIGIDLGTASILVYIRGKGVVLKEPSVVAFDRDTDKIKAIGEDARLMLGRTPGNIVAVRPLRQGVISDYNGADDEALYPKGAWQKNLPQADYCGVCTKRRYGGREEGG